MGEWVMHNEHCEIIPAAFAYRMEGAMLRTSFNPQNVRAISVPCAFFYLVEQLANVVRYGTHTQAVQRSVQHVGLYAGLMERLRPFAHGFIRILPKQQIYLFKTSAIGFQRAQNNPSQ